jgi:toxin FitB
VIVLDTNVVSELMRPQPNVAVATWVANQPKQNLLTTSITQAEVLYGIARLPAGRRRDALAGEAQRMFRDDFDRILAFDTDATLHYANILSGRHRAGKPMAVLDAQIAAIALAAGASVATRDTNGFEGCGVALINPWAGA